MSGEVCPDSLQSCSLETVTSCLCVCERVHLSVYVQMCDSYCLACEFVYWKEGVVPLTQGTSLAQLINIMSATSSSTLLSSPTKVQASWVSAPSWWEVKLKLLPFAGTSIGAVWKAGV